MANCYCGSKLIQKRQHRVCIQPANQLPWAVVLQGWLGGLRSSTSRSTWATTSCSTGVHACPAHWLARGDVEHCAQDMHAAAMICLLHARGWSCNRRCRRWRERAAIAAADNGDAPPLSWRGPSPSPWGQLYGTQVLDPSELRPLKVGPGLGPVLCMFPRELCSGLAQTGQGSSWTILLAIMGPSILHLSLSSNKTLSPSPSPLSGDCGGGHAGAACG